MDCRVDGSTETQPPEAAPQPTFLAAEVVPPELSAAEALREHEIRSLRERVQKQHRLNRTLSRMVRNLVGGQADQSVELKPKLALATPAQQPVPIRREADGGWWPTGPRLPNESLRPPVGHDCFGTDGIEEVVGVSVLGLRGADLEAVISEVAEDQLKSKAFIPVFLTDQPDFRPFVSRGYAFEYLSGFRAYLAPDGEEIRKARLAMLERKWGFAHVVSRDAATGASARNSPLAAIMRHNSAMSPACHRDRFQWIIETLRISLSSERYDVAEGLAEYVFAFFDRLGQASQIAAARLLCRKFIAFGEQDRLRRFLFKNIAHVKKDDGLFSWFSVHCTSPDHFSHELARLPSGKPNSYYISTHMAAAGHGLVPALLSATEEADVGCNLLLANHFAHCGDAALYTMFVNRVVAKGRPALREVNFSGGNILAHLAFEKRPQVQRDGELISVIMSAHNAADTIGYAARSILSQTYANIELLICDDCSDDDTPGIASELCRDPRVRLFRSVARQGTYNIRNNLIREARGAYLTFQDADDFAFPDRLERQLAFLKEQGAAAVAGRWFRVTKDGQFIFSPDQAVARLSVVSLFAPRAVFQRFGPYRAARFGADTEFYEGLRLQLGADAVKLMDLPLIFGLSSAASLTRSAGIEATDDGYRAPARRAYAAAAAMHRHVRSPAIGLPPPDEALRAHGNLLADAGVAKLGP